jgi:hypothetical protein
LNNPQVEVYMADPATGDVEGAWDEAAFGEPIAVRITGEYRPVTAAIIFMPDSIPMQAVSMMNSEAN